VVGFINNCRQKKRMSKGIEIRGHPTNRKVPPLRNLIFGSVVRDLGQEADSLVQVFSKRLFS